MKDLTPRKIVEYLDEYIVGQQNAKRSVAVALRNRWRSSRLPKEIAREVSPKNILLIGPTGVGKTEIARRIAALTGAPFVKVEATKYTAARTRFPLQSESFPSNLSKRANASATEPANPAMTFP